MYDLVIKNGKVIDGTGGPSYYSDVAIKDGKIVKVAGGIGGGNKVIDAKGLVITPGFIDSHSHSDGAILESPDQKEKVEQGITTSVGGQCGSSRAPVSRDTDPEASPMIGDFGKAADVYKTMGRFLSVAKNVPQGANIATHVGHCALRLAVMGTENRKPTDDELERMKELLRDAIEHGAVGISFGLIYTPGCYAGTDELIELAKIAGEYNAVVSAHIRNEGDNLIESAEEFIKVVKAAGTRGVISHHKAAGKANWGKVRKTLELIEKANEQGVEIYCDVYPYNASHTALAARFVPKEYHAFGLENVLRDDEMRKRIKAQTLEQRGVDDDLSWVQVTSCPAYPHYEGMRVNEIAKIHGKDVYDTVFDMIADSGYVGACYFTMCEEDIEAVISHPRAMICTDSSVAGNQSVYHPRLRASFPRAIAKYVREKGTVSLPEMIRKMTSMPASVYGLKTKGLVWEGFDADLCIFDPDKISDKAEYTACSLKNEGLNYVIVGGEVAAEDGVYNGKRNGKVILRG